MKGIVISENNIEAICGRLKKFFMNNEYFLRWSAFDCGSRKKVKREIITKIHHIYDVHTNYFDKPRIFIMFNNSSGDYLSIGDKIQFSGNKITIKEEFGLGLFGKNSPKFVYTVYQITS